MFTLVRALMSVRGFSQSDLARVSQVSRNVIVRYLSGGEIKSESLIRILSALGLDLETLLKKEVTKTIGTDDGATIADDIMIILKTAEPIERRTIIDFVIARLKKDQNPETKMRLERIKRFAESIETVRGNS